MSTTSRLARSLHLFPWLLPGMVSPAFATTHLVDPMTALIREYSKEQNSDEYIFSGSDESYASWVTGLPPGPYANLAQITLSEPDRPTLRALDHLSTSAHPVTQSQLHDMKVWDLGFTKSHVGKEVPTPPAELWVDPGAANVVKAGVEPDIYRKSIRILGQGYPAIVANYVVAAQVLRAKLANTPRALWEQRGLRHDVLDRFVHANGETGVRDFDLHYLIHVLEGEMATWHAGSQNAYGRRELPVALRVARIAAAIRIRRRFDNEPCLADGTFHPSFAGQGGDDRRPLCFDDATDRSVHAWYAPTLIDELASIEERLRGSDDLANRMAAPLRASRQGWIGVRRTSAFRHAVRLEVAEAKIVDRLLESGEVSQGDAADVSRRALRLVCGKDEL